MKVENIKKSLVVIDGVSRRSSFRIVPPATVNSGAKPTETQFDESDPKTIIAKTKIAQLMVA